MKHSKLLLGVLLGIFLAGVVVGRILTKTIPENTKVTITKTQDMTIVWIDKAGVER